MALYKYFKRQSLPSSEETNLGEIMTREANAAVQAVLNDDGRVKGGKRKYTHYMPEQRAKIAKYATENGNTAAVRHFAQEFPSLGESTVRSFKKQYLAQVKKKPGESVEMLPKKKRGRPLTLGELDVKVQQYVRSLRKAGTPVNARIVMAAAEGIVKATDRTLLVEHGGSIQLTQAWAYSILNRMGFVKRKATTKAKLTLSESAFKECKARSRRLLQMERYLPILSLTGTRLVSK